MMSVALQISGDVISSFVADYPLLLNIIPVLLLIFVSYIAFKLTRIILIKIIVPQIKKSKTKLDDAFLKNKLFLKISYLVPIIIIYNFSYVVSDNLKIPISLLLNIENSINII